MCEVNSSFFEYVQRAQSLCGAVAKPTSASHGLRTELGLHTIFCASVESSVRQNFSPLLDAHSKEALHGETDKWRVALGQIRGMCFGDVMAYEFGDMVLRIKFPFERSFRLHKR